MKKIIFFYLLLLGAEKAVPKEIIDNIDLLKELDFFLLMDMIEKEDLGNNIKYNEKSNKKEKKDLVEISTHNIIVSSQSLILSTETGRIYEK